MGLRLVDLELELIHAVLLDDLDKRIDREGVVLHGYMESVLGGRAGNILRVEDIVLLDDRLRVPQELTALYRQRDAALGAKEDIESDFLLEGPSFRPHSHSGLDPRPR